jgi:hypothetical protein
VASKEGKGGGIGVGIGSIDSNEGTGGGCGWWWYGKERTVVLVHSSWLYLFVVHVEQVP